MAFVYRNTTSEVELNTIQDLALAIAGLWALATLNNLANAAVRLLNAKTNEVMLNSVVVARENGLVKVPDLTPDQ